MIHHDERLDGVAAMLAEGLTTREIARRFGMSQSWAQWARGAVLGVDVTRSATWLDRQRWLMRRGVIP